MRAHNTITAVVATGVLLSGCSSNPDATPSSSQTKSLSQEVDVCTDTQIQQALDSVPGSKKIPSNIKQMTPAELNNTYMRTVEGISKFSLRAADIYGESIIANADKGLIANQEIPSDSSGSLIINNLYYDPKNPNMLCSLSRLTLQSSVGTSLPTLNFGDRSWTFKSEAGANTMGDGTPLTPQAVSDFSLTEALLNATVPAGAVPQATYNLGPQSQSA